MQGADLVASYNNIDKLINLVEAEVKKTVREVCKDIYKDSQVTCPVDTGFLLESGGYTDNEVYYATAYSDLVEYKQEFLRNAYLDNIDSLGPKLLDAVQRAIRKAQR